MRKFLFASFLWEIIRFFFTYLTAASTPNFSLFTWLGSQQIIAVFAAIFLFYDFRKFFHFIKLLFAAKIFSVFTGFLFVYKTAITTFSFSLVAILLPCVIIIIDIFFLCIFYFILRKAGKK